MAILITFQLYPNGIVMLSGVSFITIPQNILLKSQAAFLDQNIDNYRGLYRQMLSLHDLDLNLNECFKWHIYTRRRTLVSNYFEIHPQL